LEFTGTGCVAHRCELVRWEKIIRYVTHVEFVKSPKTNFSVIVRKMWPVDSFCPQPSHNLAPLRQAPISPPQPLPPIIMTPRRSQRLANPSPIPRPKPPAITLLKRKKEVIDLTITPRPSPPKRARTTKRSKKAKRRDFETAVIIQTADASVGTEEMPPEMPVEEPAETGPVEPISTAFREEMTCSSCRTPPDHSSPHFS
jgi:hypothetical protein